MAELPSNNESFEEHNVIYDADVKLTCFNSLALKIDTAASAM